MSLGSVKNARPRSLFAALAVLSLVAAAPASGQNVHFVQPVAEGRGGGATTVDAVATGAAIRVLERGGNAVDGAIAAAAWRGVTEPYSAGIGGGGFFVIYRGADKRVFTIDHREKAPAAMRPDSFIDPATGQPMRFAEAQTSGLSAGVPGTLAGWQHALDRFGTMRLSTLLQPASVPGTPALRPLVCASAKDIGLPVAGSMKLSGRMAAGAFSRWSIVKTRLSAPR